MLKIESSSTPIAMEQSQIHWHLASYTTLVLHDSIGSLFGVQLQVAYLEWD